MTKPTVEELLQTMADLKEVFGADAYGQMPPWGSKIMDVCAALRERLVGEQKQLPKEFAKVVNKEFWNLLEASPEPSDGKE
jgi:hypothetical protein